MITIKVRNVNEAFPLVINMLKLYGNKRNSRNGPVLAIPEPVSIEYTNPTERVLFNPIRDCNPFFHLYESLWMLMGRHDMKPLLRYTKQIENYSDDGSTLHGAYGFRWRHYRSNKIDDKEVGIVMNFGGFNQLEIIAKKLRDNPEDRRCVLSMWDATIDLGRDGKDLPCNLICTLSRSLTGALDITVFQRSGDAIWGVLGANVVQFSFLQEYLANWIGCPVGTYHQVCTNFHAYLDIFDKVKKVTDSNDYYVKNAVSRQPIEGPIQIVDEFISSILHEADTGFTKEKIYSEPWAQLFYTILKAHHVYKTKGKFFALEELWDRNNGTDWELAAVEWLGRRKDLNDVLSNSLEHP